LVRNPLIPETFFLESFIGGLKPVIKSFLRAFNPQNLYVTMEVARCQEETVHALKPPPNRGMKMNPISNTNHYYLHPIQPTKLT